MKLKISWADATSGGAVIGCRGLRSERVPVRGFAAKLRRLNKLCVCGVCGEAHGIDAMLYGACRGGCGQTLRRVRFFGDSNSDWLDWPTPILADALDAIRLAPNVDVLLSSKWPELWAQRMRDVTAWDSGASLCNLWLEGVYQPSNIILLTSVVDQVTADRRIPALLRIPAARRGLSCEPLLESVDLRLEETSQDGSLRRISWVVVGCESGPNRRFQDGYADAARSLIEQCREAGVAVWVKQWPVNGRVSRNSEEWPHWAQIQKWIT